jgi:hypothetical protein
MPLGFYFRALLMVMGPSYMLGFAPAFATAILFHIIDRFASSALSRPITALAVGSAFSFAMGALLFRNAQAPTSAPHTRILEVSVLILDTTISGGLPAFLIVYFRKTHPLDWPRWLRKILGVRAPPPDTDGAEF